MLPMRTEAELEDELSRPSDADIQALAELKGDLLILGVGGKMGPTLARLARRASEAAGVRRRVIGAARFSSPGLRESLESHDIETLACDLLDREQVSKLPDCPNVVYMIGQKFGTSGAAAMTWAVNALAPAAAAERFRDSRIVSFSTGNVYPLTKVDSGGPNEDHPTGPVGEYAQSALARERVFQYFSERNATPTAILRLNYAVEPRYGVLRDVADKVFRGEPIDLSMGYANVIWQRDASSVALRSFGRCASPPFLLNLTGPETISIRQVAAAFGERFGREAIFTGEESETALLNDARRCREMFGPGEATLDEVIAAVADWTAHGGAALGKPTHYEQRDGRF